MKHELFSRDRIRVPRWNVDSVRLPTLGATQEGASYATLRIDPNLVRWILSVIVLLLTIANLIVHAIANFAPNSVFHRDSSVVNLFDLDFERNLPTWYQVQVLFLCGILLAIIGFSTFERSRWTYSGSWLFLSAMFFFLSFDEMASIHERLIVPLRRTFDIGDGIFYFAWVIPAAAFVVILFLCLIPFLLALPDLIRNSFLIAGAMFVTGAVGMEVIGGAYFSRVSGESFTYKMITTTEEVLEMVGLVIFFYAVLRFISMYEPQQAEEPEGLESEAHS